MPLEIVIVPCLRDNYAYLLHAPGTETAALVDAPESAPIVAALKERGWTLSDILITHHHADHIDGVDDLRDRYGARVIGNAADATRLPVLDEPVAAGDRINVCGQTVEVIDVSGHTVGHVAFHIPAARAVFSADSLMALGCGRLFEGTPQMMWDTMRKFMAMPDETLVYSGHEYTASNARFAQTIEPGNADLQARAQEIEEKRARNEPTVPATIGLEKATNPFLRAHLHEVKAGLDMESSPDAEVFAEIRKRKDSF